jgi:hypothetical protein
MGTVPSNVCQLFSFSAFQLFSFSAFQLFSFSAFQLFSFHGFHPRNRKLFPTTLTLLNAMAALAMTGDRSTPKVG